MHYETHGHTAAEVIFTRVNSEKDNLGLNTLNRMVSAYLDIAEINALDRHPMTMQDWTHELDSFLKMTRKDILKSHKKALKKAHKEYDKYMASHSTTAENDYLELLNKELEGIDK